MGGPPCLTVTSPGGVRIFFHTFSDCTTTQLLLGVAKTTLCSLMDKNGKAALLSAAWCTEGSHMDALLPAGKVASWVAHHGPRE